MTEILLRAGDTMRIEDEDGRVITVSAPSRAGHSWEIRIGARHGRAARAFLAWWRRCVRTWREDRDALRLAELDERTLKDIGLEHCAGSSLAARVREYRHDELRRLAMARLGLM